MSHYGQREKILDSLSLEEAVVLSRARPAVPRGGGDRRAARGADLGEPEHPAAPGVAAADFIDHGSGRTTGLVHHPDDGHPLRVDGSARAFDPADLLGVEGAAEAGLD